MPGREGSPGSDGNEVHGALYGNSVVVEALYVLASIDSCVHPL